MITETMTVHEALSELKTLDKRIEKKIAESTFCTFNRHSNIKIDGKSIDQYQKDMLDAYQSVVSLINRRAAIRCALAKSNYSTTVEVNGRTYTLAEAIELKNRGLELKQALLRTLTYQHSVARSKIDSANASLQKDADVHVQSIFGNKDRGNPDDIQKTRENYIAANTVDMIDPLNVTKKIEELNTEIDAFTKVIDSRISVSNALNTIDICY